MEAEFEYFLSEDEIRNMIREVKEEYKEHLIDCTITWWLNGYDDGYGSKMEWHELLLWFHTDVLDEHSSKISKIERIGKVEFISLLQKESRQLYFKLRKEFPFMKRELSKNLA